MAKKKITASRKQIIVVFAVFLTVVGVAVAVAMYLRPNSGDPAVKSISDISNDIDNFTVSNGTEASLAYYDEQVEATDDVEGKKTILVMKSRFALREGVKDEAIKAATSAHGMGSDAMTTRALAEVYALVGDKEQAIEHYRELIDLRTESGQTVSMGPSIEDLIEELEK